MQTLWKDGISMFRTSNVAGVLPQRFVAARIRGKGSQRVVYHWPAHSNAVNGILKCVEISPAIGNHHVAANLLWNLAGRHGGARSAPPLSTRVAVSERADPAH
jgi:hypothetical protein